MTVRDNKIQTILRVDLSDKTARMETLPEDWTRAHIGCRGMLSRLLFDEVRTGTDPYGPDNVLYFGTGPLDGLPIGMGRMSVACKSPRGTLAEGGFGGFFGPEMRRAGIDYLAIRGKADRPVYLYIDDGRVEIREAGHLWGLLTNETDAALRRELQDPDVQMRYIGPAGEKLVHSSPIFGNINNSGGRAGCGQVMGSKKLKAIAVRGRSGIRPADNEGFIKAYKSFRERVDLKTSRDPWTPVWSSYGAPALVRIFADMGNQMTRNAQVMQWDYHKAEALSEKPYLDEFVTKAKACWCCPWPACQKLFRIQAGRFKGLKGGNYWAGQALAFGSLIDNDDLEFALVLSALCNQYGLDIFHVGYTLAWAMECFENGLLTSADTGGLELRFGHIDQLGVIELVRKTALREGFGEIMAQGCAKASQVIGRGSERFCLSVKGMELEGIAQRSMLMVGLGIAVSEVGPDHTRWYPPYPCHPDLISRDDLKSLGIDLDLKLALDTRNPREKGKLLRWFTISRAIVESLPSCVFLIRDTLGFDLRPWWNLFRTATGLEMGYQEFLKAGERTMNLDRAFNIREGFRRIDDRPPLRMATEDVPHFGYSKLEPSLFDPMLDEYYQANGWDAATSIPCRRKLEELGLMQVADELESLVGAESR
jgi:aldehyde:ferredoxin oxidoreductase